MLIEFTLNGQPQLIESDPGRRVIDLLREDFGLTGSKEACSSGECGACSILVQGESRLSCLMLACQLQGREVQTIEGLNGDQGGLHPLQQAFIDQGAVQCGYCSPGMLIAAADLLARQPRPTRKEIRVGLSGNLCRCTGYQKIVDAVELASQAISSADAPNTPPALAQWPAQAGAELPPMAGAESPARPISRPHTFPLKVIQPASLDQLVEARRQHPGAALMAGGTDLLVWLREGRLQADGLLLTGQVPELQSLETTGPELIIGAGVAIQALIENASVRAGWPLLAQALEQLGSPPIRHMATLAGNICSASPAGDSLPALYILEASLELAGSAGRRQVKIADFISGPGRNGLNGDECVVAIKIPRPAINQLQGFIKVGQRQALAIAIASLAYSFGLDDQGRIRQMKLAWGSVGPTIMRFPDIEEGFESRQLNRALIDELAPLVSGRVEPISDVRASAAYRRSVAGRLLYKILNHTV